MTTLPATIRSCICHTSPWVSLAKLRTNTLCGDASTNTPPKGVVQQAATPASLPAVALLDRGPPIRARAPSPFAGQELLPRLPLASSSFAAHSLLAYSPALSYCDCVRAAQVLEGRFQTLVALVGVDLRCGQGAQLTWETVRRGRISATRGHGRVPGWSPESCQLP
jgi:hypothetical protein